MSNQESAAEELAAMKARLRKVILSFQEVADLPNTVVDPLSVLRMAQWAEDGQWPETPKSTIDARREGIEQAFGCGVPVRMAFIILGPTGQDCTRGDEYQA